MPALTYARAHSLERCSSLVNQDVGFKFLSLAPVCPATPWVYLFHFPFNSLDKPLFLSFFLNTVLPPHPPNCLRARWRSLTPNFRMIGFMAVSPTVHSGTLSTDIKAYYTNKNRKVLLVSCDN